MNKHFFTNFSMQKNLYFFHYEIKIIAELILSDFFFIFEDFIKSIYLIIKLYNNLVKWFHKVNFHDCL